MEKVGGELGFDAACSWVGWFAGHFNGLDLRGAGSAAHGGDAAVVAVRQFLQRRALRAPSGGLFLLCGREGRGPPYVLSLGLGAAPAFGGAGADEVALHVGEAPEYRQHQAPGLSCPADRDSQQLR
jgi:hypothetical protein